MEINDAILLILEELKRAQGIHPEWPSDPVHASGIVCEEAGELIQAALNFFYEDSSTEQMKTEAVHTGAMALRFLINL